MPFYEYQCGHCGHTLEAMQKVSDPPLKKCPHCGKAQLQKLMSAPVFRLKGSGWYETDFKSDQDNKRNLADKADADVPKDEKKDKIEGKDTTSIDAGKPDKPADKASVEKGAAAAEAKKPADRSGGRGASKKAKRPGSSRPARPNKRPAAKSARRR
jgi:putative FmdB family regulatory protein